MFGKETFFGGADGVVKAIISDKQYCEIWDRYFLLLFEVWYQRIENFLFLYKSYPEWMNFLCVYIIYLI